MIARRPLGVGLLVLVLVAGMGCTRETKPPAAMQPILIGVVAPFFSTPGEGIRHGAAMAVAEINAAGGVNGRPLRIVEFDDQFAAAKAVEGYQWLAGAQHVVAVVGFAGSGVFAAMEQQARYGVPIICTGVGADRLTDMVRDNPARYGRTFRVMHRSSELADVTTAFIRDFLVGQIHLKRFAIMVEDDVWTKYLSDRWRVAVREAGGSVVFDDAFSSQTTDFAAMLSRVRAADAEYILDASSKVPSALYLKRWAEMKGPLIGAVPTGAGTKKYYDEIGPAGIGVNSVGTIPSEWNPLTTRAAKWHREYSSKYGDPEYTSAYSYDATYLLRDAIVRAGVTEPAALVKALEQSDHQGVAGRYQFGPDHHPRFGDGFRVINMVQYQFPDANGYRVVWPRERATGEFRFPSWYVGQGKTKTATP
jgi:branched-chain amino acid transport system substrate-binding protein